MSGSHALFSSNRCSSVPTAVDQPTTTAPSAVDTPAPCWKRPWTRVNQFLAVYPIEVAQTCLLVEVASQSYQAKEMSGLLASVWLNRLLVTVIIVNCWFTPLVFWVMRRRQLFVTRVVRLLIDTALDAVYSFGIPIVILYPYYRDYVPSWGAFPPDFYSRDTWAIVAAAETRQVFVSSWLDFASKTLPWFSFCYRLYALRRLVSRQDPHRTATMETVKSRSRVVRLLDGVLVLWGIAILTIHAHVTWISESVAMRGCLVELRPWFRTAYTCAVVELSCSQRNIVGSRDELTKALAVTDTNAIQGLILSHCPALEIPTSLPSLSALALFKLYNSTLVAWGVYAALTNPSMQQFFAIRTNFSTRFPDGLLSPDLPATLRDVKFIATNLTTLPLSFATAWRSVYYVAMELNPFLREVPDAVARLPNVAFLSMSRNAIESIPDGLFQDVGVNLMVFDHNPIAVMPKHLGRPGTTKPKAVVLSHTSISSISVLPASAEDEEYELTVLADATPLCAHLLEQEQGNTTTFSVGRFRVDCVDTSHLVGTVVYPIASEDTWRQLNRIPAP